MNRSSGASSKAPHQMKASTKNTISKRQPKVAKKVNKKNLPAKLHPKRSYHAMGQSPEFQSTIHSESNQPAEFGQSGHQFRVKKLYRKMLKDHYNWYGVQYDNWIVQANDLRDKFEQYKGLTDTGEIETVIKEAEIYLASTEDPNPYRPLMHPQGGVWGRNDPPNREILKPQPTAFVLDADYHEEERVVRHLHASPEDPDFAPSPIKYAQLKIKRGEYWLDNDNPASVNHVVQKYCEDVGITYMPSNIFYDVSGDLLDRTKFVKVDVDEDHV